MLQLHSLSSKVGEWSSSNFTVLQWQLPLCSTSVLMIARLGQLDSYSLPVNLSKVCTVIRTEVAGLEN